MKGLRYILFTLLLPAGMITAHAQNADFVKAYNAVRTNVDSAKIYIDRALKDTSLRHDPQFWYVRGFVYKELYKKYESSNKLSKFRDTAVTDMINSVKLDSSADNKKGNFPTIKYLAGMYYNDAGALMDSIHYLKAKEYYKHYIQAMAIVEPGTTPTQYIISYNLKLGEIYSGIFFRCTNDKQKTAYLDSAKQAYNAVLALNPNDISANYNLAILFYNQAVYIINRTDYGDDISKLNEAQDTSIHLAMQSLPYMQKTYQLDPHKKDALKGLSGIYYLLHDPQKFQEFEDKLKQEEGGK